MLRTSNSWGRTSLLRSILQNDTLDLGVAIHDRGEVDAEERLVGELRDGRVATEPVGRPVDLADPGPTGAVVGAENAAHPRPPRLAIAVEADERAAPQPVEAGCPAQETGRFRLAP